MANVVVVGSQWGDEGKGKIVDWLSERADIVVRFQGGHNAGHTLVVDGTTYKLSLLPSGVVRKGKLSVIGNGVVVDPWALAEEIAKIEPLGRQDQPRQSPHRRERDADPAAAPRARLRCARPQPATGASARPSAASARPMRTRSAGAPSGSWTCRICRRSKPKIERILAHHNPLRRGLGQPEISADDLCAQLTRDRAEESCPMSTRCGRCSTGTAPGQAHPVRGRARRAARYRPRHLSVRHLVEHGGGAGRDGLRRGTGRDRLRARHHQGLHHAGGRGAVPHRAQGRDRQAARRARRRVRHGDRAAAPLRLVRRLPGAADAESRRHQRHRADQARRARPAARAQDLRRLPARRLASSTICRRRKGRRPASSRSTRRWKAGPNRRAARGAGPSCRRNASNMCGGSRS